MSEQKKRGCEDVPNVIMKKRKKKGEEDHCEEGNNHNSIRTATVVREEDFYHYVNFRILDSIGYPGVLTVILNHTKTCYKLNTQCHIFKVQHENIIAHLSKTQCHKLTLVIFEKQAPIESS